MDIKRNNKIDKLINKIKNEISNKGLEIIKLKSIGTIDNYGLIYSKMIKPNECQCILSITQNFNVILDVIKLDIDTILDFECMIKNIEEVKELYVSMPKENARDYMMDTRHLCKDINNKSIMEYILDSKCIDYNDVDYILIHILMTKCDIYENPSIA